MGGSLTKNDIDLLNEIYSDAMTKIYQANASTISTYITNIASVELEVKGTIKCRDLKVIAQAITNLQVISGFTTETAAEAKTLVDTSIENKTNQIAQAIIGFMAGFGKQDDVINRTAIQNRVTTIISNSVTSQNLNNIVTEITQIASNKLTVAGDIIGDTCLIQSDAQANLLIQSIVRNVQNAIVSDEILTRIVNDIKQTATLEQKGIDSIVGSFALIIIVIAIVIIVGLIVFATTGVKALTNPKFWITMLIVATVVITVWLIIAAIAKLWPFRPTQREFWGCSKALGPTGTLVNTRTCSLLSNPSDGPYFTEKDCKDAIAANKAVCPQYWGCAKDGRGVYTGTCTQYDSPIAGPYYDTVACHTSNRCDPVFICDTKTGGEYVVDPDPPGGGVCIPFNKGDITGGTTLQQCGLDAKTKCTNHYICLAKQGSPPTKECVFIDLAVYGPAPPPGVATTMTECMRTCR